MSPVKERLCRILDRLPLSKIERRTMEEGIEKMSEEEAADCANSMKKALDAAPAALDRLEKALKKYEGRSK